MYVRIVPGGYQVLMRVLKGKLARLTQRVQTIRIEQIPVIKQEFIVGIPPTQIHLIKRVVSTVLVYIEAEEAAATEEPDAAEEVVETE